VAALCLLIPIGSGLAWGADEIPADRDPWGTLRTPPGVTVKEIHPAATNGADQAIWFLGSALALTDMEALGSSPAYYDFEDFEAMLTAAAAESLCAEIQRAGWEGITRERALALAPTLGRGIEKAEAAGLLRGFLAVTLQDTRCAEPPADVLDEALRYLVANDRDTIVIDEASMPDYNRCLPLRTDPPAPRDPQEVLRGLPDPVPPLTDVPKMREV
jgi:hypothetical protein